MQKVHPLYVAHKGCDRKVRQAPEFAVGKTLYKGLTRRSELPNRGAALLADELH